MSKFFINSNELKGFSFFDDYIEKAKKGEQVGGDYIWRENIAEKVSTNNGKEVVRRYKYYYISDLLKDTADKILKNIGNFFFKGKPEEVKKIEKAYDTENIKEEYNVDRKTWYQHVMEYFAHRSIWDKRFADKNTAAKWKKPVKVNPDKINDKGVETPVDSKPEIKTSIEKKKPKWKANPSLMRKIWSLYTGKELTKDEKNEEKVEEVINKPSKPSTPKVSDEPIDITGVSEEDKKIGEKLNKIARRNGEKPVVKEPKVKAKKEENRITLDEQKVIDNDFGKFMNKGQLQAMLGYARKGAEKNFYIGKMKELVGTLQQLKDNWYQSYDEKLGKHKAGLHLFDANNDFYITEWDGENEAFGYTILNGDKEMAEWGYIDLPGLIAAHKSPFNQVETDLYYNNSGYVEDDPNVGAAIEVTPIEEEESEAEEHNNRSLAMMGNQNAKKDGIIEEEAENAENNIGTERSGISDTNAEILAGDNQTDGGENISDSEAGSDTSEPIYSDSELGVGLGGDGLGGNSGNRTGTGRLTKGAAKKIREKCREILAKPDSEITEADKAILREYEGAGGLHEGDQSNAGVLTEFYTPRDVIKKVWQLVDKYVPNKNKKVIEPSAGTGRFAEGRDENFTLCELDETSARIAHLLHPNADVKQGAFQKLFMDKNAVVKDYKGEKYDVAVGNPPYGEYSGRYKGMGEGKIHTRYEEYFIDRTLDTLKDDGIMAFVVPSGFLRNASSKAKEAIAAKGKLLEAWRLPKGTFSSTDVGTDIIVLRKEPGNIEDFSNNKYFTDNPSHVIGTETFDGNWGSAVINLPEGKTVAEAIEMIDPNAVEVDKQIAEVAENVETKIKEPDSVKTNYAYGDEIDTPKGKGKVTGFKKNKGKITGYIANVNGERVEISAEEHNNRSEAMKGNDNAKKLVHKEKIKKAKEGDVYVESKGHNMSADEFAKKFGQNVPAEDMKFWKKTNWEGMIEINSLTDEEKKEISKNKNFIKASNGDYIPSVNYASGNIYKKLDDLEAEKENLSKEDYDYRKSLLETALPARKNITQITVGATANFAKGFVDEEGNNLVDRFLFDYCGFGRSGNTWDMKLSNHELEDNISWNDIWDYIHQTPVRTERPSRWLDADERAAEAETNKMMAEQKKQSRRECAERLFNEFLRKLPEDEQKKIEDAWNRQFNAYVNQDFKKIPLFVEGLSTHKGSHEFNPTDQQIKGITEVCSKGNGILAYDVGVGKTFCGITATVNQLQTGKCKHPLIMVPKSVYKKWIKEIHQHFPDVQVNELGNFSEKDLSQYKNADGKFSLPDNSLNVCTYEALQKVTFKEETLDGQLRDDMMDSQSIYDYDAEGNLVADTRTDKEKAEAAEKIEKLLGISAKAKEGAVYWEDLGIDHITVDELHNFKNVFSIPRNIGKSVRSSNEKQTDYWGRKIKAADDPGQLSNEFQGLNGASSSRAMKLFAISQLIQAQNDGRGFFGLSATPFNNSPVEIYNILSLVARNRLKDLKIYNLQDFLREFAELKPDWKVDAKGNTTQSQTMKSFKNLAALQNLITEFIDKVDGEEAGVVRPRKQTHRPELDLTPLQKMIIEAEKRRMDGEFSGGNTGKPTGDVLVAMNNMRMATLSPALIDPKFYADYQQVYGDKWVDPKLSDVVNDSPKLKFVCDSVTKQFKERPTEGQVIYMPRGVEQYNYVKDYLVAKGMPEDSIAFMDSSTSLENKERIKDDFNDPNGKIKVIIGSETIKEGVSLNGNSTTLYNTMLGWNPTETIQVEGRIWRQGNTQGITHIVYPLMNDSIDSMMMQKYDEKSSRLNALWSYKGDNLNVEDYDPEEVKFQLIKDPEKRASLKILRESADLKKTNRLLGATYDNLYSSNTNYKNAKDREYAYGTHTHEYEEKVEVRQKELEQYKADLDKAKKTLAAAKKAKDDDLIDMANQKVDRLTTDMGYAKDRVDRAKSDLRVHLRNIKEFKDEREGIEAFWQKQGINSPADIDKKLQEISAKRQDIENQIEGLKAKHDQYVEEAREQLKAEAAAMRHDSIEDVVNDVTGNIAKNLRPMDDALKAEIRAELEEKYPNLKKSLPLFFFKDGRFFVRKGL